MSSPFLQHVGMYNMTCTPKLFFFKFCHWRGFKNKTYVCHILCEELFMLDMLLAATMRSFAHMPLGLSDRKLVL